MSRSAFDVRTIDGDASPARERQAPRMARARLEKKSETSATVENQEDV